MRISTEIISVHMKRPFTTSQDRTVASQSVVIRIEHDGVVGLGEAKVSADACGGKAEPVGEYVGRAQGMLGDDPFRIEQVLADLRRLLPDACCTRAGIDIALHDLCGKLLGTPLYRLFGLSPENAPLTSYTIGIDTIPAVLTKLQEARGYPILKLKVGVEGDTELVRAVRDRTQAVLRVDANGGWKDAAEATERINRLEACDIELIEQPIPPGNPDGLRAIREQTGVAIFADEDARTSRDLPALAGCVDGVNVKLMECGGLREAVRMIHVAHGLGMQVMLGCMVETSLSLTAAAHLSPLVEQADLDSHLLIRDDPFEGLKVREGRIILPGGNGLGVYETHPA
jgi:L-alanine-DL-glutamate epimerase-like enolase superfamily enzyme